jgi:hypothetical protein
MFHFRPLTKFRVRYLVAAAQSLPPSSRTTVYRDRNPFINTTLSKV